MVIIFQIEKQRNITVLINDRTSILTQVSESKSMSLPTLHSRSILED